jgi:predicted  nucleic acid-binding Zn-ribbon protein
MPNLAARLVIFHRLARELALANARLEGVPEEMRALHEEYTAAQDAIDKLAKASEDAAHDRRVKEGSVAEAQEKLRKFQQQVSRVRKQNEYAALLSEIDQAKTALRNAEEGALDAIERAERLAGELGEQKSGIAGLEERYRAALADWEAKKPEVAAEARALGADLAARRAELPKPIAAQYERISVKYKGDVLTSVRRAERPNGAVLWHCATCNYQLRSQLALEVRTRGAVVQCDGCKRFLLAEDSLA